MAANGDHFPPVHDFTQIALVTHLELRSTGTNTWKAAKLHICTKVLLVHICTISPPVQICTVSRNWEYSRFCSCGRMYILVAVPIWYQFAPMLVEQIPTIGKDPVQIPTRGDILH